MTIKETHGVKPNYKYLITLSDEDKSIGSINASKLFGEGEIHDFSGIIIDIRAMPRGFFLPLINKLLYIIDKQDGRKRNRHVIVAENPELDSITKWNSYARKQSPI